MCEQQVLLVISIMVATKSILVDLKETVDLHNSNVFEVTELLDRGNDLHVFLWYGLKELLDDGDLLHLLA